MIKRKCYIYFFPLKYVIAKVMEPSMNVLTVRLVYANLGTIELVVNSNSNIINTI